MKKIENGIVFSNDITRILKGKNALDFNYNNNNLIIPNNDFIEELRKDFKLSVNKIFNDTTIINENDMKNSLETLIINIIGNIPIITLDKIYLNCDNKNIIFLDCTRLDGNDELVSRNNINDNLSVEKQIEKISKKLKKINENKIILVDDVVFSGNVISKIINLFKNNNIEVLGIISGITTNKSYEYFNKILKLGINSGYILGKNVIDQICERDFYFGIAQSGISIKKEDNKIYKAPYFIPYGNPNERASIPKKNVLEFSKECLYRSLILWQEIEKLSNREIYIKDLPEKINNTNEENRVVKVLKKEWRNI